MTDWRVPDSVLSNFKLAPKDRPVAVLLRHSVRDAIPPDEVGYDVPITTAGERIALELGRHLGTRLRTLHSSPLPRCTQTAEALKTGAGVDLSIVPDRLLGDPGIYVLDGELAWKNWQRLGHAGVIQHLVSSDEPLEGMAVPSEAASALVEHMLAKATEPGVHVFVTHDTLVLTTAARVLGVELGADDWPWFLEGALFWSDDDATAVRYRGRHRS